MASHVIKNVGEGARETARKKRGRRVHESYTQLHMVFIDLKLWIQIIRQIICYFTLRKYPVYPNSSSIRPRIDLTTWPLRWRRYRLLLRARPHLASDLFARGDGGDLSPIRKFTPKRFLFFRVNCDEIMDDGHRFLDTGWVKKWSEMCEDIMK